MIYGVKIFTLIVLASIVYSASPITSFAQESIRGTIVVAVPVKDGLVVCADKRLFNEQSFRYTDNNVKIRKVSSNAIFVATNTVGFYDPRTRTIAFNAFEVTERFVAKHDLAKGKPFWDGLKKEINAKLRDYFAPRSYDEWPASDRASNNLLFNLIFYTTTGDRSYSHTLRVFYEKAKTPIITIPDPIKEEIKTTKLAGKGREVMSYIARTPMFASDPLFRRFGGSNFDRRSATVAGAKVFAGKLIYVTSTGVPRANVSPTSDCAILDYQTGFRWVN